MMTIIYAREQVSRNESRAEKSAAQNTGTKRSKVTKVGAVANIHQRVWRVRFVLGAVVSKGSFLIRFLHEHVQRGQRATWHENRRNLWLW